MFARCDEKAPVPFDAITGLLETLTPEAVNTALKDYLTTENLYYSVVTPESSTLLTQLTEESSVPVVYANNDESVDPQQWADTIAKKTYRLRQVTLKSSTSKGYFNE